MEGHRRRTGRFEAAAAIVARSLPKAFTPRIEQARLDAGMLLDRATGKSPAPLVSEADVPTPLHEIDTLSLLPRSVAERLRTAGRDIGMLRNRLILGRSPSPTIERPKPARGAVVSLPRKSPDLARPLRVVKVEVETNDAISVYLTEADGSEIQFKPGQFLSVDVEVNGEKLRRAYSLASACLPGVPRHITVKRIHSGRCSNQLNETVREGDELRVLGPSGSFTVDPRPVNQRHLVMIAGGSGITPIMSILETVLRVERGSRVTLIYGNRGWDDVIFRDRLETLRQEHPDRLTVDHVLEQPPSWWTGERGLLTADVLASRLEALKLEDDGLQRYFLCGPTPMMEAAHEVLAARGITSNRIAEERFTSPEARTDARGSEKNELVIIARAGREQGVQVEPGQTVLEAALGAGIDMPFSCAMGGCGSCRVRVTSGEIRMEEPNCLSRDERERGYALTCIGRPVGACSVEVEGP